MQQSFRGREATTRCLDRDWTFSRWTIDVLDDWTAWARTQLPSPIDACAETIERMELAEQQAKDAGKPMPTAILKTRAKIKDELVAAAMRQAASYLDFASKEVQTLIRCARGAAQLFYLLLKPKHPDITLELAFEIIGVLPPAEQDRIMATTYGAGPQGGSGNESAPAAPP